MLAFAGRMLGIISIPGLGYALAFLCITLITLGLGAMFFRVIYFSFGSLMNASPKEGRAAVFAGIFWACLQNVLVMLPIWLARFC